MKEILVSICIPAYNHEKFIAQAIESVLKQNTGFEFRIFIGEDNSTDRTREICLQYQNKFPEKIVLLPPKPNNIHRNLFDVYNACINSGAKYIAILDGDDYWLRTDKLQKQVEVLEQNRNLSMVFTNSLIINEIGETVCNDRVTESNRKTLSQREILSGYCPPTNTVLFRSACISEELLQGFFTIINFDYYLFNVITEKGDAGYLDIVSAAYRRHTNGLWSGKSEESRILNYIKTCCALFRVLNNNKDLLENNIKNSYEQLINIGSKEDFTDNGFWTPQSKMLQSIRDEVFSLSDYCCSALSIDENPTLDRIFSWKWPELQISKAVYPHDNIMNLHRYQDNSFDLVYSHQVLEHVPKPWIAAREIVRVLKPGGIGIHTSCAFNPRHGLPEFQDYYRFLPDGLAELFDGVDILVKAEWGSRQAILYNVGIDDGNGSLGGRRFHKTIGETSDGLYPWHTWVIFRKNKLAVN